MFISQVKKPAVDTYSLSGKYGKPPYCEMILRAVSDSTPPPDLTVSLTLTGGRLLEPITLERKAEHLLPSSPDSNNQGNTGCTQSATDRQEGNILLSKRNTMFYWLPFR